MRVEYEWRWGEMLTQHVAVVSLPDEATVWLSVFHAGSGVDVEWGPAFPVRAESPPGFEKPIRQYRGRRWLNMGDHLGFVSADPLPSDIPTDRFALSGTKRLTAKPGEWFGQAGLVVYARQPHQETAAAAESLRLVCPRPGRLVLSLRSSSGERTVTADFGYGERP